MDFLKPKTQLILYSIALFFALCSLLVTLADENSISMSSGFYFYGIALVAILAQLRSAYLKVKKEKRSVQIDTFDETLNIRASGSIEFNRFLKHFYHTYFSDSKTYIVFIFMIIMGLIFYKNYDAARKENFMFVFFVFGTSFLLAPILFYLNIKKLPKAAIVVIFLFGISVS